MWNNCKPDQAESMIGHELKEQALRSLGVHAFVHKKKFITKSVNACWKNYVLNQEDIFSSYRKSKFISASVVNGSESYPAALSI